MKTRVFNESEDMQVNNGLAMVNSSIMKPVEIIYAILVRRGITRFMQNITEALCTVTSIMFSIYAF